MLSCGDIAEQTAETGNSATETHLHATETAAALAATHSLTTATATALTETHPLATATATEPTETHPLTTATAPHPTETAQALLNSLLILPNQHICRSIQFSICQITNLPLLIIISNHLFKAL